MRGVLNTMEPDHCISRLTHVLQNKDSNNECKMTEN